MTEFPHLKLPLKVEGIIKTPPRFGGKDPNKTTTNNKGANRYKHGEYLGNTARNLIKNWDELLELKKTDSIVLPNDNDIPVFLKIDTDVFDTDSLIHWGIEVISEEEEGCVIGASLDGLKSFQEKINQFLKEEGRYKDTAAKIWNLETDDSWRVEELIKGELGKTWNSIENDIEYTIQLGVSCYTPNKKDYPNIRSFDSEIKFEEKVEQYYTHIRTLQVERDKKQLKREDEIEQYIGFYEGTIHEIWDNEVDAIYFKISINGKGLKDIVQTYQYLYEVRLDAKYSLEHENIDFKADLELEIIAPDFNAARVCIIDSGIQENHQLLQPAIDTVNSRSYADYDTSTADYVKQSGHGTKVAGAVLYPVEIPKKGQVQLESIIENARILNSHNRIPKNRFEPKLMEEIVSDYDETRIFNLSIAEDTAYIGTHMPSLSASLDKLIHENDILFIVAAGNLSLESGDARNPGIKDYLQNENAYPTYLNEIESKVANPGVSYFAITVGSIAKGAFEDDDYKSLAGHNNISPFSRTGLGMWGCIKPDVVEFGGDLIKNKMSNELITKESTSPELVNSTLYGASSVGKDSYGTSFSTPKVSYIASRLQSEHPKESASMYRALIIQSARLPEHCFNNPTLNDFRYYGYGVPDINRALSNSESRITFIQDGNIEPKKADIYRIRIPEELKGEGREFRVLVEVTLTYTSKTRLTRKGSHSYLSNWLEWKSSKYNEGFNSFRNRTVEYIESDGENDESGEIDEGVDVIKWVVRENPAWSNNGINRNNSTVQKSWVIIEPHQFAEDFSIAVVGHFGWDKNVESETPYALCVSFEALDIKMNIYNILAEAQIDIESEQEVEVSI